MSTPVGTFCLVIHTHLPWLAHHGSWPVGEEWLYQSWAASYIPTLKVLEELAGEGRRDLLTIGVTPVVAAQLDDPHCLSNAHIWLNDWMLRAEGAAGRREAHIRAAGQYEYSLARATIDAFEGRWRNGVSPVLRPLADAGVVEVLGGPAAHPFQPLLRGRTMDFSLRAGLQDGLLRRGVATNRRGIWAPECGYRPGLEEHYRDAGVSHLMLDGPTLLHVGADTSAGHFLGSTDVVAFGRDLSVTYRVWSPRKGYPGGEWYRDFHTFDHGTGLRPARVTSHRTPPDSKSPYQPERAAIAVRRDAADFVGTVRRRLEEIAARRGRPGLVVAGYDTELFGHWWHEGPAWLAEVLRLMPEAGIRLSTLAGAIALGHVEGEVKPDDGSWGSGKDWHVWNGDPVQHIVQENDRLQHRVIAAVDAELAVSGRGHRNPTLDQLCRSLLLALQSDWAFMVSKDSAANYAWERFNGHRNDVDRLAGMVERAAGVTGSTRDGALRAAGREAARQRITDGPFGHLDARTL